MTRPPNSVDPRSEIGTEELRFTSLDEDPVVGREVTALSPQIIIGAFAILAIVLFVWLNARRSNQLESSLATPAAGAAGYVSTPPPELIVPAVSEEAAAPDGPFSGLPTQVAYAPPPPPPLASPSTAASVPGSAIARIDAMQRRRAPAVVVDLGPGAGERVLAQADAIPGAAISGARTTGAAGAAEGARGPSLSDSEQFARRVGDEPAEQARATVMRNPGRLVPQGAIIPGVLETAINSDLPGYTRAVVSRDVLSFDGRSVLIPRGSRLIGQYKSAVALGQSRAFIIWTRVIRPDGVSVQIGSPGTDALGRGGLGGDVDRHFFRRFSGSILLSVLNAGVAAIGSQPATQITIGSPSAAAGVANSALQGEAVPPTIKVPQGESIRIFVSRDLDFSGVEAVR